MGFVTATYSYRSADALVRFDVVNRFLRESGLGEYGTATSGSTTTIVNTGRLKNAQYPSNRYVNAWARIGKDAGGAGAAPEGELGACSAYAPSTGTVTVPTMTQAVAVGDGYQMFWGAVHPQDILDALDDALREDIFLPDWSILTECPDGDMDASAVSSTDWGTASNATVAKSTAEPAMAGKRYMTVTTTSAGGYQPTQQLKCVPGRSYHLSVGARADAAGCTPTVTVRDVTNGTTLATLTTTSQAAVRLFTTVNVPATCFLVEIRLGNAENSKTSSWDDLCWFSTQQSDLPLPRWLRNQDQLKGIFTGVWDLAGTNAWNVIPRMNPDRNKWDFRDTNFGNGQCRIVARQGVTSEPVFIFATRNETAFANDNLDFKNVDANTLQAALGVRVFTQLMQQPNSGRFDTTWMATRLARYEADWKKLSRAQSTRLEEALQAEETDISVFRSESPYGWAPPRAVI